MSESRTNYIGDSVETTFLIGWTYTDPDYVFITVSGIDTPAGWGFSIDGLSIVFDTAPASGAAIVIYRKTGAGDDDRKVIFTDGVYLDQASLDLAQRQTLHIAAENQDGSDAYPDHVDDSTIHVPTAGDANDVLVKDSGLTGDTSWHGGLTVEVPDIPEGGIPHWPNSAGPEDDLEVAVPTASGQYLTATKTGDHYDVAWTDPGAGLGDVVGPTGSYDGELALFDDVSGKLLKGGSGIVFSGGTITFGANIVTSGVSSINAGGAIISGGSVSAATVLSSGGNTQVGGNLNMLSSSGLIRDASGSGFVDFEHAVRIEASGPTGNALELTGTSANFECSGNIVCDSGAFSGGLTVTAGPTTLSDGNLNVNGGNVRITETGASINISDGTIIQSNASGSAGDPCISFDTGGIRSNISTGTLAPTHSTYPGSLYVRQSGAASNLYINTSTTNPGTTWTSVL